MMRRHATISTALGALLAAAVPAAAQQSAASDPGATGAGAAAEKAVKSPLEREITIQHIRPQDQRGLTVFEPPKDDDVPFNGFHLEFGASFAQQFQALDHANAAAPDVVDGVDRNRLIDLGAGFNLATANLYANAQLAPGIRVALESYMSSRGHSEFWVKGGYLQIDRSPIDAAALNALMEYVTLKVGHFEINYGDAHFRRSDNGNALYNPFVGNYILDAFTTEIGGEVYVRAGGVLGMLGVTNGEIKGAVADPDTRAPSYLAKLGFDRRLADAVRVRLTGSLYMTERSANNTLYSGDRAGARYYEVMVNQVGGDRWSGNLNPGLRSKVTAFQVNPFVKIGGLELFGVIERAEGRAANETADRSWDQYAVDAVYRFLPGEKLYVGGRYNTVAGRLAGMAHDVGADRYQLAAGWFVTPTVLLKGEYVSQEYNDFPATDIRHGGKFDGFMVEGVVSF